MFRNINSVNYHNPIQTIFKIGYLLGLEILENIQKNEGNKNRIEKYKDWELQDQELLKEHFSIILNRNNRGMK